MNTWERKVKADMTVEKMRDYLYHLPEQFAESLKMEFDFVEDYRSAYENIVVSGLGGSAIGGDILRTFALQKASIPVVVNRDYNLPAFVGEKTLFYAVSYSGNTEETLSAYRQARERGAAIVCFSSGGELEKMARLDGKPVVKVPTGLVPRAATGYLFAPLVLLLEKLGIVAGARDELGECVLVLRDIRDSLHPEIEIEKNPAKKIARELKDSIPIIWGSSGISEVAALRWKAQINENAKSPAYYHVFPELNHNEIVGFEVPAELVSRLFVVILKDRFDHERVKRRMAISRDIIKQRVKGFVEVESRGESFLARLYSLCYTGDYASFYLALENGINPTPVALIDFLKAELAK